MVRIVATAIACLFLSGIGGGVASAKSCRDAHGKFTKCPTAVTAPAKTTRCRDAKGRFKKCSTMKK